MIDFTKFKAFISEHRRHTGIILIAMAFICCIVVAFLPGSGKEEDNTEQKTGNVIHDIPDASTEQISNSKSEAYITGNRGSKIGAVWDDSLPDEETLVPGKKEPQMGISGAKTVSEQELFPGGCNPAPSPTPKRASSNPYRETAEEREARHQRRQEEAIELAERMQENQRQDGQTLEDSGTVEVKPADVIPQPKSQVKRSDVISSLDGWDGDGGLSSLDNDSGGTGDDPYAPFRCMFARESKVSDGQRVTVILLDDLMVSGISVPRNTHLMATCQISNRLELEFTNIEIGGKILPLGYEAYDVDGSKGIYCPDAGTTSKTVKNRGTDIATSALSSRLGRVARDVASTGIAIIQSADGQRTVSIPAGYTFFIVKKKQNQ